MWKSVTKTSRDQARNVRSGATTGPGVYQARNVSDSLVITGLTWASGGPEVRLRRNAAASVLEPLGTFCARYTAGPDSTRWCIGHKPFRDSGVAWEDCDRTPLHDGRTCDRCAASDATFASQLHHAHNKAPGELDAAVLKHLQQPNELYLACFRDGSIKVGTSTEHRLQTRLTEQGAWKARVVASATDGFAVRSIEDRVTVALGLPQSVSVNRKARGLVQPRPDDELVRELNLWTDRVHGLIADAGDERLEAKSVDWSSPLTTNPLWSRVHAYPLKPESGSHDLEFIGASGRVVAVRRPAGPDEFVFDLRKLFGIELALGDETPDELAVQDSLF
jgi:hypothetical protein